MKVSTFIDNIGEFLQEDFTYAPLWTKEELLGNLRQAINEFNEKTSIVDKNTIAPVDGTTGELTVASDFSLAYYVCFNNINVDLVQLGDLDFVEADWLIGTTGTAPTSATLFGSGKTAKLRFTPVPSSVASRATSTNYGLVTAASFSGVSQTFVFGANSTDENYGVIVDATTTGVLVTPAATAKMNQSHGVSLFTDSTDLSASYWYKGGIPNVDSMHGEIYLGSCFIPVLEHRVLSLAFNHDDDGRDIQKAQLLEKVFEVECASVKNIFQKR